jgi:branched-chain amino acid transport system substrate-binding protein
MTPRVVVSVLAVVVCLSLVGFAAGSPSSVDAKQAPVVIAVEGPQSGSQASNGLDQLRGVRLAVQQLNARGGLWDGKTVQIYAADDQGDQARAKAVARGVISKGIRFVIGPYNSSVGVANLSLYRRNRVLPLWMTSRDETAGAGATVQPMNSQIAPVEERYVKAIGATKVTMLVDDTANGAFTKGMATRLRAALEADGATVNWISVEETDAVQGDYYTGKVQEALATNPDLIYVSTYFPEGVLIAKALTAAGSTPSCLMGLANVDNGFVAQTSLTEAQRCAFSGVPAAPQMPSAAKYVQQYRDAFKRTPGVWGSFTFDSANILFRAINRAKSYAFGRVQRELRATRGYRGATGTITIDPGTGLRTTVPVSILRVDEAKTFVVAEH